jgi:hypothetical protein
MMWGSPGDPAARSGAAAALAGVASTLNAVPTIVMPTLIISARVTNGGPGWSPCCYSTQYRGESNSAMG